MIGRVTTFILTGHARSNRIRLAILTWLEAGIIGPFAYPLTQLGGWLQSSYLDLEKDIINRLKSIALVIICHQLDSATRLHADINGTALIF